MTTEDRGTPTTFEKELEHLINRHSLESASNTPDFILAQYLQACLALFATVVLARDEWHDGGKKTAPAMDAETAKVYVEGMSAMHDERRPDGD